VNVSAKVATKRNARAIVCATIKAHNAVRSVNATRNASVHLDALALCERASMNELSPQIRAELLAYARKRAPEDAEDLVQRTMLKGFEAKVDIQHLRAWLFQVLRRELVDNVRRRDRTLGIEDSDDLPATNVNVFGMREEDGAQESCPCVLTALQRVSKEERALLTQTILDERPLSEIACASGTSKSAVAVRAFRARKVLRERLQAHCGTSSLAACLTCSCGRGRCCDVA
jgi:RNA polymerase sigma factor (sigma-70 family)